MLSIIMCCIYYHCKERKYNKCSFHMSSGKELSTSCDINTMYILDPKLSTLEPNYNNFASKNDFFCQSSQ